MKRGLITQAFACVFALTLSATAQTAQPTDTDTTAIVSAMEVFLQARADGDDTAAYAMIGEGLSGLESEADTRVRWTAQTAQGIAFEAIRVTAVTWYVDPDGLPSGAYAAVDFAGGSPEVPIVCGFIVWRNGAPLPLISQIELNVVNATVYAGMDEATRQTVRSQFGCR